MKRIRRKTPTQNRMTLDLSSTGQSPAELFTGLLAVAIQEKPQMFLSLRGSLAFEVEGDRSFTVNYGNRSQPLAWEAKESAELRFFTDRAGLGRILNGTVDPGLDLESGALRLEGNLELLRPLFKLMERAKNMVALRASR